MKVTEAIITDARERGLTVQQLADELEVSRALVWKYQRIHGVWLTRKRKVHIVVDEALMRAGAKAGRTLTELSAATGHPTRLLLNWCRQKGIDVVVDVLPDNPVTRKQLHDGAEAGLNATRLAEVLGVVPRKVQEAAAAYKIRLASSRK